MLCEWDVVVLIDIDFVVKFELCIELCLCGFMMVFIGKDGGVKLCKFFFWDVCELG